VAKTGLSALRGCDRRGKREPRHNKLWKASPDKASTQSLEAGVIGMLTSNGILAAASFLVGIAPSKTLPHRQATLPLCA
jgi:hypothetical protein